MKSRDYIIFFFCLIILALLLITYMKQPAPKFSDVSIQNYKDSIARLDSQISFQMKKIATYEKTIDSLNSLPAKIKIKYRDQKASVPSATVIQLDSIIRANAGLPQR